MGFMNDLYVWGMTQAGCCFLLVKVLSGHSHVIGCFECQNSLKQLHGESHVSIYVLYGIKGRTYTVGCGFVQVSGGLVPLL